MAIFLAEDEIGFDEDRVGFPKLGGCMAVALLTPHGFFGFHNPPGHTDRTGPFAAFCGQHAQYGPPTCLYGSCKWQNRYAGGYSADARKTLGAPFVQWVEEMKEIARHLNFTGKVAGLDLTAAPLGIPNDGSAAYCEYKLSTASGKTQIRFSLMSDTQSTTDKDLGTAIRKIHPNHELKTPYLGNITTGMQSTKGRFSVSDETDGYYEFTIT